MAAPLSREVANIVRSLKVLSATKCVLRHCQYSPNVLMHKNAGYVTTSSAFHLGRENRFARSEASVNQNSTFLRPEYGIFSGLNTTVYSSTVFKRHYGRKMITKPPKITHFEYSGDLRSLPDLDKNTILYTYRGIEDQLEENELMKRLSSLEFASSREFKNHRKELVRDRMVELFGPDSELEQQIALLTLEIRQMIPYCIQYRLDKLNKIWLLKRIFRRRRLLTRLRELDHERLEWLLRELKIRYVIPRDREEYKGWKHNKKVATQNEALAKQRKKLEELKEKFEEEKKIFHEHRAKVMAEIERDLKKFGLSEDFLAELQKPERETSQSHHEAHKRQDQSDHTGKA